MIRVENVNKYFKDKHVLKDVSTAFQPGKVSLVIGKSGSGKTVLLKSLVGLHEVDNGSITFNNRDFVKASLKQRKEIRRDFGMLFQANALFDSATIEENVMFPLDVFTDLSYQAKIERANFCLKRVNLEGVNKLFPGDLSGGMQKRAGIARAIALNPKYLFCDEPNSGLDPQTALVIDHLIREITIEYNITTIINTHDMNSVFAMADFIVFIFEGKSWWQGSKEELFMSNNEELNQFLYSSEIMQQIHNQTK